jgi:uncharacterized membrane protein YesL
MTYFTNIVAFDLSLRNTMNLALGLGISSEQYARLVVLLDFDHFSST